MPSLIPGYEYDIFISYRQKDNKHDGWVTEFVENLKGELESTFKEDVSLYFDINPHDGLLETHDVDASLKEKLKCLIFIPIISRTYCDPRSFAWEHEFKAFVEMASEDKYGLKVKLSGGNVASRVLPVLIHELDQEDRKIVEAEIGGHLRGIEFIYKEPGVNRPLKQSDNEAINLKRLKYCNQINKVANSIEEIITGIASREDHENKSEEKPDTSKEIHLTDKKSASGYNFSGKIRRIAVPFIIIVSLVIAGIILYPELFTRDTSRRLQLSGEKVSIAILPFQNMTNDSSLNVWQNGLQDMLTTSMSGSNELTVRPVESVNSIIKSKGITNYASITPAVARSVSRKLRTTLFIYGSIHHNADAIRLNIQLINSNTAEIVQSFHLDSSSDSGMDFAMVDSLSARISNYLILNELVNENVDFHREIMTNSPKAYYFFILGKKAYSERNFESALEWWYKALEIDSNFYNAESFISAIYLSNGRYKEGKAIFSHLYQKRHLMSLKNQIWMERKYAQFYGTYYDQIEQLLKLKQIDDNDRDVRYNLGLMYALTYQYEKAIPELEKAIEEYRKWGIRPSIVGYYYHLGLSYHETGQFRREKRVYRKAEEDFPDDPSIIARQAIFHIERGDSSRANKYIEKLISKFTNNPSDEINRARNYGWFYNQGHCPDKAEIYFRKAHNIDPENSVSNTTLGYFLIDSERNINEGLKLIEEELNKNPGSYSLMDSKGWGLYKQGKYRESLDLLEQSWALRMKEAVYNHDAYLHLEAARKAVSSLK